MKKRIILLIFLCFSMLFTIPSFAHGGGIDANGGHHDYNNVSGFGSYHYHCDGHVAHLHTDGICPFSSENSEPVYTNQLIEKSIGPSEFNSAGRKEETYTIAEAPDIENTSSIKTKTIGDYFMSVSEWIFLISSAVTIISLFASGIFSVLDKKSFSSISGKIAKYSFLIVCIMFLLPILGGLALVAAVFAVPDFIKKILKKQS